MSYQSKFKSVTCYNDTLQKCKGDGREYDCVLERNPLCDGDSDCELDPKDKTYKCREYTDVTSYIRHPCGYTLHHDCDEYEKVVMPGESCSPKMTCEDVSFLTY